MIIIIVIIIIIIIVIIIIIFIIIIIIIIIIVIVIVTVIVIIIINIIIIVIIIADVYRCTLTSWGKQCLWPVTHMPILAKRHHSTPVTFVMGLAMLVTYSLSSQGRNCWPFTSVVQILSKFRYL